MRSPTKLNLADFVDWTQPSDADATQAVEHLSLITIETFHGCGKIVDATVIRRYADATGGA